MTYLITILTAFSSVTGFIIQALLARQFGIGNDMDLYLLALSIPLFAAAVFATAYSFSIVPQLVGVKNEKERIKLNQGVIIFSALIGTVCFLGSFLVDFQLSFYSNSNITILDKHRLLFRLAWLFGGCQIMLAAFATILTAEKRYLSAISLQLSPQVGLLGFLLFFNENKEVVYLITGSLSGCLAGLLISLFSLRRYLLKINMITLQDLYSLMKKVGTKALYGAVASSVFGVYVIVDAIMAPFAGVGVLTSLAYSQKVIIGFGNIATVGVFTVAAPQFKEIIVGHGPAAFLAHVKKLVGNTIFFSIILAVGLYVFTDDILRFFFKSDVFLESDVDSVTLLVMTMLPGMVAMLASSVLFKALFCLDKIWRISIFLGVLWPILYFLGIAVLPGEGAIKFSQSYTVAWILFSSVLMAYMLLRIKGEILKQ